MVVARTSGDETLLMLFSHPHAALFLAYAYAFVSPLHLYNTCKHEVMTWGHLVYSSEDELIPYHIGTE